MIAQVVDVLKSIGIGASIWLVAFVVPAIVWALLGPKHRKRLERGASELAAWAIAIVGFGFIFWLLGTLARGG